MKMLRLSCFFFGFVSGVHVSCRTRRNEEMPWEDIVERGRDTSISACLCPAEPETGSMQDVNPPRPKAIGPAEALGVRVDLSGQAS